MKLTAFAKQLRHFDRYRELRGVPREPLSVEEVNRIERLANGYVEQTLCDDNEASDYDALPGRVLQTIEGSMTRAVYEVQEAERHLDRLDVFYRERRVYRVHQTPDALEVFESFSHPDFQHRLECWRVDYRDPQRSFYQHTSLAPDPWV